MNKGWLNHIEDVCHAPMTKLGYAKLEKDAIEKDTDVLVKNAQEVWPYITT